MALGDSLLKQVSKDADKITSEAQTFTSKLKSRAALVISIFAAIYSIDAFIGSRISSTILNQTIHVNDVYNFYQAKSIKQNIAEYARDTAIRDKDTKKAEELEAAIARYESDPKTNEGKRELLAQASVIDAEIDHLKRQSPWIGLAGSIMQIAIVLITASILSSGMLMFWAGLGAMVGALALMGQGLFLWF
jgi:hypothetical protein